MRVQRLSPYQAPQLQRIVFNLVFCIVIILSFAGRLAHAGLPEGQALIPASLEALVPYGPRSPQSMVEQVAVTGQPFDKALRVNTYGKLNGKGEFGLSANINTPLHKGDVLWISFKARRLESKSETGEASFELRFDQLLDGKYKWPAHMDRGISFGADWTETSVPFVIQKDVEPKDVRLIFKFDSYEQNFELGPVRLINYGSKVELADLPRSVVRYDGGEPDAPWRKDAAQRIEKIRKGDLSVRVTDAKGKPVEGAEVSVHMKRNAFNWGTAITSKLINDTTPDGQKYRENLSKYFNQVVFENEIKYRNWILQDASTRGVSAKKAGLWLRQNGLGIRGHVLVWPAWRHTPPLAEFKTNPEGLRAAILNGITDQTTVMRGEFDEWDVVNEATLNHEFMDVLGQQEMLTWFKAARAGAPGVKLFYNDFTMFHGKGPGSGSQKFFDIAKYLKDNGAEVDVLGEQGHIGGTPPAISDVLERLDYFSKLGWPIQISEFDINSNDDEFKTRYMSDFMTAIYSHPSTVGFVQWGFWEGQHWFPVAALWNKDWSIRKHGQAYADLVSKTWWTNFDGKTAKDGVSKLRGFTGEYEITVKHKGKTVKQKFTLDNKGGAVVIKL